MELNQNVLKVLEVYAKASAEMPSDDNDPSFSAVSKIINNIYFRVFLKNLIENFHPSLSKEQQENIKQEYLQWYSDLKS